MNAKKEFLSLIGDRKVECAKHLESGYDQEDIKYINLKVNYTEDDYYTFLNDLDFIYDSGYGGQLLYGIIWFKDGDWAERAELPTEENSIDLHQWHCDLYNVG